MTKSNGESEAQGPLELREHLHVTTHEGRTLEFEVVGILEDPDGGSSYVVLYREAAGDDDEEFIVTDMTGNLLSDAGLAQEILDDFLVAADENADGDPG